MLQRVEVEGIKFPRLYIAENMQDVELARSNGIPYVRWTHGMRSLIRQMLRPTLEKMFPGINWSKVLGRRSTAKSEVIICPGNKAEGEFTIADSYDKDKMLASQIEYDGVADDLPYGISDPDNMDGEYIREVPIAESPRDIVSDRSALGYGPSAFDEDRLSIEDYVGDLSSSVDIEALQKLSLLPKFVGDIASCITRNLSNSMYWTEGYNKKLAVPLGNFKGKGELPNLIIIDVSASIPDGIAATMLTLADTLRSQCNAELIITSRRSGYYPCGAELPKPQTLRNYYGRGNESAEFMRILEQHIAGREFGHVISFGDYDNPGDIDYHYDYRTGKYLSTSMANTKVHAVHHYHTWQSDRTGYARWVHECCPDVDTHYDTSWCSVMKSNYKM